MQRYKKSAKSKTGQVKNLRHLRNLRDLLQRPNRSRFRLKSVRNPWSKNALLTQRNPMNKNIQVKSGLREFSGIMQKLFPYKKYQVGVQFLRWF